VTQACAARYHRGALQSIAIDFPDWAALLEFLRTAERGARCFDIGRPPRLGQFVLLEVRIGGVPREYLRGRVTSLLGSADDAEWMRGIEVHFLGTEKPKLAYLERLATGRLAQVRREPRLPVLLHAAVTMDGAEASDAEAIALAEDIGRWGAFLRTSLRAAVDAHVWVVIASGTPLIGELRIRARVAWAGPEGLGVSFVPFNETECGTVIAWVDALTDAVLANPEAFCMADG